MNKNFDENDFQNLQIFSTVNYQSYKWDFFKYIYNFYHYTVFYTPTSTQYIFKIHYSILKCVSIK